MIKHKRITLVAVIVIFVLMLAAIRFTVWVTEYQEDGNLLVNSAVAVILTVIVVSIYRIVRRRCQR